MIIFNNCFLRIKDSVIYCSKFILRERSIKKYVKFLVIYYLDFYY